MNEAHSALRNSGFSDGRKREEHGENVVRVNKRKESENNWEEVDKVDPILRKSQVLYSRRR
jgi:hypothetical protein